MITFLGVIIVIIVIIFPQTQGGRARLSAASFPVCSGLAYETGVQEQSTNNSANSVQIALTTRRQDDNTPRGCHKL